MSDKSAQSQHPAGFLPSGPLFEVLSQAVQRSYRYTRFQATGSRAVCAFAREKIHYTTLSIAYAGCLNSLASAQGHFLGDAE